MRIEQFRFIPGPNIYNYEPVLIMRLDLQELAETASTHLPGFTERLLKTLPGLWEHGCSRRHSGGFVERLREGTYLGHIIEHVALELSNYVDIPVNFGKTRYSGEATAYNVIVECPNEPGMRALLETAVDLVQALIRRENFDLEPRLRHARNLIADTMLGPSTRAIVQAAQQRGIPWHRLNQASLVQLGYGKHRKYIEAAMADTTSAVAVEIAGDKQLTKALLEPAFIPMPFGRTVANVDDAIQAWHEIGGPVVVKPVDGAQGRGVSLNLDSAEEIRCAFDLARAESPFVLVEELFHGKNYRVLVVNGKMVAASERLPALVVGDGEHTIAELVDIVNQDPRRGEGHSKPLTFITLDAIVMAHLKKYSLTPAFVPAKDETILLRESANLSTGGTAIDVTNQVHPETVKLCERAARLVGLDICGIDLVANDIAEPLAQDNGIIELNASPGLRMHAFPSQGQARPVGEAIIDVLYPHGGNARIPIITITGTNGKTTVTRLIAHIFAGTGKIVGMTSTDGVIINNVPVTHGDDTGPRSARIVLSDPRVEVAVLETARGGIARNGLAYDWSDVGVITNIQADHIGVDGIRSVDDLVFIKSLLAERVRENGTLVLNADDENVMQMAESRRIRKVNRHHVYFTLMPDSARVRRHRATGGTVYFEKKGWIIEAIGNKEESIVSVASIPITLNGQARFNVANVLAAIAACRAQGLSRQIVAQGVTSFVGSAHNSGRVNLYRLGKAFVMLDYGHNPHAFEAIAQMAAAQGSRRVTGVVTVPGDRADWVIQEAGRVAARSFHRLIVREDKDLRGRHPGEIARLLFDAARQANPDFEIEIILDEEQSYRHVLKNLSEGELAILFFEKIERAQSVLAEFGAVPVDDVREFSATLSRDLAMAAS